MVFDPVGGAQGSNAMGALARNGQHLAVGFASGSWAAVDVAMMAVTNTSLVGVLAAGESREHIETVLGRLTELLAKGAIRDTVQERFTFDELPAALTRVAQRKPLGKCVLETDREASEVQSTRRTSPVTIPSGARKKLKIR